MKAIGTLRSRLFVLILATIMMLGVIPVHAVKAAEKYEGGEMLETVVSTDAAEENINSSKASNVTTTKEDVTTGSNTSQALDNVEPLSSDGVDYNGGWAMAASTQVVYHSSEPSIGYQIGTIYKNEGITVLWTNGSGTVAHIEYSTSNGTKRGFLYNPHLQFDRDNNSVAQVNVTSAVYYGESASAYQQVGTVYAGEFVVVLGKQNGWAYIEYNTNSGRKRGYMSEYNMEIFYWGRLGGFECKPDGLSLFSVPTNRTVYAGPSTQYYNVGSVSAGEVVYYGHGYTDANDTLYTYIEYYVNGTSVKKSGYIID